MDVANTETLTEVHAGLYLIVVLVFIAQAWQVSALEFLHTVSANCSNPCHCCNVAVYTCCYVASHAVFRMFLALVPFF